MEILADTDSTYLWSFLPWGYLLTILIETPILFFGLSPSYAPRRKIVAGIWLTACTYPIVVLVMPLLIADRITYLAVAETFAPGAECLLFWLVFQENQLSWRDRLRDYLAIVGANLASFLLGLLIF